LLTILEPFGFAFACYLAAIRAALAAPQNRRLLIVISAAAVIFRITLLFSSPIEEIDLYRYLWDGQASLAGVSPFRYSPRQVLEADASNDLPSDLAKLVAVRDCSTDMPLILDRIHFGELPTIYPPTSQAIFALAAVTTPKTASLTMRMTIMKTWFVVFDLATLWLVVLLLRWIGKPAGWSLAYAWCPLLIKEVANSGHLDALAVFLTTLAIYLAVRAFFPRLSKHARPHRSSIALYLAASVTALAIGAKLYPIVLVPLLLCTAWRTLGWRRAALAAGIGGSLCIGLLWPMVPHEELADLGPIRTSAASSDLAPLPPPALGSEPRDPSQSLRAFLSEWEMNDFLFLLIMENVRPTHQLPPDEVAWFSILPESWRNAMCTSVAALTGSEFGRTPFFISRTITSCVFVGLALALAFKAAASTNPDRFLEAAFLTVAWFWLLLPTQNPWYWTWALPLLPFARSRLWLAMGGLALLYYVRFWLCHYYLTTAVLGTIYKGPQFFDYVVTWLEFGPWFCALMLAASEARARTVSRAPATLAIGGTDANGQNIARPTANG
jgi:hypothetical protein